MPITGLPDPAIHRKCKRCGTWCHLHEGVLAWPPRRGLFSVVHVALAESMDRQDQLKFYCVACRDRNAHDERSFRKLAASTALTLLTLAALAALGAWLGLFEWSDSILRRP